MTSPLSYHSIRLEPKNLSVSFGADIEFEQFDDFATPLAQSLDCRITQRHWGADRHQWQLEFEGCFFTLNYEFYSDVCWLHVEQQKDWETLEYLASLMKRYCTSHLGRTESEA